MKSKDSKPRISYSINVNKTKKVPGCIYDGTMIPGNLTISEAVQKVLRDLLKNDEITVSITEHTITCREI